MKRLVLALTIALPLVTASRASANSDLETSLRHEADAISGLIKTIDSTLATANRGKLSERSVAAHRAAKNLYGQAETQCRDRKYEACYRTLRESKKTVMPAVRETFQIGVAPEVHEVVAIEIKATAKRIAGVATLLAKRSTPAATAAYKRAEALYKQGETLYSAGKVREAFAKLEPALDELDVAIRAVWTR